MPRMCPRSNQHRAIVDRLQWPPPPRWFLRGYFQIRAHHVGVAFAPSRQLPRLHRRLLLACWRPPTSSAAKAKWSHLFLATRSSARTQLDAIVASWPAWTDRVQVRFANPTHPHPHFPSCAFVSTPQPLGIPSRCQCGIHSQWSPRNSR